MNAPIQPILLFFYPGVDPQTVWGQLLKADPDGKGYTPAQSGDRWITVHPWGDSVPGIPILVREHPTHKGVWHVIGGAGGKLNYLKLRGLKPEGSYAEHAKERAATRKALQKQQAARDQAAGLTGTKAQKRAQIIDTRRQAQHAFLQEVARVAGWDPQDIEFPAEQHAHLSPAAYQVAQRRWLRETMARARTVVEQQRAVLMADATTRGEVAGLVALVADPQHPEQVSVADLDPIHDSDGGLGYAPDYLRRASEQAGGEAALREELAASRPEPSPAREAGTAQRRETLAAMREELAAVDTVPLPPAPAQIRDVQNVLALIKAQKSLRASESQTRRALHELEGAEDRDTIQAMNVTVGPVTDADAVSDLADQLRTVATRAFLDEVDRISEHQPPEQVLGRHIGAGAAAVFDSAALAVAGQALVDRSAVDVLGIDGAAHLIAERLRGALTPEEFEDLRRAVDEWHVDRVDHDAPKALEQAQAWLELAETADPGVADASDTDGLEAAQKLNRERMDALQHAKQILGTHLGKLEASAALGFALREKPGKPLQTTLGRIDAGTAAIRLRALGLEPSDFTLERVDGEQIVTLHPGVAEHLPPALDREAMTRARRAQAIIDGQEDEPDWLPDGFARREDLGGTARPGIVERMAEPFDPRGGLRQGLQDYFGGRVADGDNPRDIYADVLEDSFLAASGDREGLIAALGELLPATRTREAMVDGKPKTVREHVPIEAYRETLEQWADQFVASRFGARRNAFHRQDFPMDGVATEALHRALAAHPEGTAAFRPIGELTSKDERALRVFFKTHVARDSEEGLALREQINALQGKEPEKEVEDMFGETSTSPEWTSWNQRLTELREKLNVESLTWDKYITMMDGRKHAYAAIQDMIRSRVSETFHQAYNTLRPEAPLQMGRQNIRNSLRHLGALDPEERRQRLAELASETAKMRRRSGGRFAEGAVSEEREARRSGVQGFQEAEMGLFGGQSEIDRPLGADERYSLGHVAETRIAGLVDHLGRSFRPGQPVKLWKAAMSGRYINQQRAVKLIDTNRRIALAQGVGSGKTAIGLAAYTHLHAKGEAKRGLFLVPSIVQDQFQAEALRYLNPGQYQWHCAPGASREERLAAYRDPAHHFCVMTHQSFRDDLLHLGAERENSSPQALAQRLEAMAPEARAAYVRDLCAAEGIDFNYVMVDEGHNALNRAGKQNSALANVLDAFTRDTPTYISASADPIKNDVSEAFDLLHKMAPTRYHDRAAFLRRFGPDAPAAREALRREMLQHLYPGRVDPGVAAKKVEDRIELTPAQREKIQSIEKAAAVLRLSRTRGDKDVDVEAARQLAPHLFEGASPDHARTIAHETAAYLGVLKDQAIRNVIDNDPEGAKAKRVLEHVQARKGKPGIVFCHRLDMVEHLKRRLEAAGHRVATLTGGMDSKAKSAARRAFSPDGDVAPSADILVTSDAGAVGMNAQRGQWVLQYDTPNTAMAQPLDARVLTPSGWRQMGDLTVGDSVITPNGDVAKIFGVFPQGEKQIYRVTFSDGSSTRCCMDHLWATKNRNDARKDLGWKIRTLEQINRSLNCGDGSHNCRPNYFIPLIGHIDFPQADTPIPHYLMGALLGDGEFGLKHVSLAAVDEEIINRVTACVQQMGGRVTKTGDIQYRLVGDGTMTGFPAKRHSPVLHAAREIGIIGGAGKEKFIPDAYLFGSFNDRLALLQGLMDTDGTVDKRNGHTSFCNTSLALINGVIHLVQSLGGVATVGAAKTSSYKGKPGKQHWKVSVSLPVEINPFSLSRKAAYVEARPLRYRMRRAILSIEMCAVEPAQCILIDHPDHLYVTDNFIVTHNTHAQRGGRVHRLGQTRNVELTDLIANHPTEAAARRRLAEKYELREIVTSPYEGLDDSGLAHYLHRRSVEHDDPPSLF